MGDMKKHLVALGILVLLCSGWLSGCNEPNALEPQTEKEKFIGTWKNTSAYLTMELSSDGTCSFWGYTGTWDIQDGKLVLAVSNVGVPFTYTYVYLFFENNKIVKLIPTKSTVGSGYILNKQ